jgi:hypothetical protein
MAPKRKEEGRKKERRRKKEGRKEGKEEGRKKEGRRKKEFSEFSPTATTNKKSDHSMVPVMKKTNKV